MMRRRWTILLLALLWVLLTGGTGVANLLLGLLLGACITYVMPPSDETKHAVRPGPALLLLASFLWTVIRASLRVSARIMMPTGRLHPAILAVPLDVRTDLQLTVLANMISLTPGTLTLDHDEAGDTLFVHVMHLPDGNRQAAISDIKTGMERRLLGALEYREPDTA